MVPNKGRNPFPNAILTILEYVLNKNSLMTKLFIKIALNKITLPNIVHLSEVFYWNIVSELASCLSVIHHINNVCLFILNFG